MFFTSRMSPEHDDFSPLLPLLSWSKLPPSCPWIMSVESQQTTGATIDLPQSTFNIPARLIQLHMSRNTSCF